VPSGAPSVLRTRRQHHPNEARHTRGAPFRRIIDAFIGETSGLPVIRTGQAPVPIERWAASRFDSACAFEGGASDGDRGHQTDRAPLPGGQQCQRPRRLGCPGGAGSRQSQRHPGPTARPRGRQDGPPGGAGSVPRPALPRQWSVASGQWPATTGRCSRRLCALGALQRAKHPALTPSGAPKGVAVCPLGAPEGV